MLVVTALLSVETAEGNGGPFVLKYPNGDPAAKGVLARVDPGLKPARENRLEVVKEDLSIVFSPDHFGLAPKHERAPLVNVKAEYTIRNPLDEEVEIDFGFPILRGIYVSPYSMMPRPDVRVTVDGKHVTADIISNSAIYGIIRSRADETIRGSAAKDPQLARLTNGVRSRKAKKTDAAGALVKYLVEKLEWNERDAKLMAAYASIDLGKKGPRVSPRHIFWPSDPAISEMSGSHLGPLAAIGEKKATQLLAHLAGLFDKQEGSGYEDIFTAWGGDVRERSVDLGTGKVRPREVSVDKKKPGRAEHFDTTDPAVYARVDYLDSNADLTDTEKEACKTILKNLPVIFTFAPMNLLHYSVKFPAGAEQKVVVSYSQYAYRDTRGDPTYQFAYVVHPASFWDEFGPITLTVKVPEGVRMAASVPCKPGEIEKRNARGHELSYASYSSVVENRTGELFVGIDAGEWNTAMGIKKDGKKTETARR